MPDLSSFINFSVKFNLTGGTPVMTLTDTSSYPGGVPPGITGYFSVTSPDGGVDSGSWSSLDVTWNGSILTPKNQNLRTASDGEVQKGVYTVTYYATHASYAPTTLSRTFTFSFTKPELNIVEDFDVFTPELKYTDSTTYGVSNYNAPTITRAWSVVSTPTGTLTGTSASIDLVYTGSYYDADYTCDFEVDLLYQHSSYAYLSVELTLSNQTLSSADTPAVCSEVIGYLDDLKAELNAADTCSYLYKDLKAKYEYASSLLNHIKTLGATGDYTNISSYLEEYILVTNNYVTPAYTNTNAVIPAYDFTCFGGGSGDTTSSHTWTQSGNSVTYTNAVLSGKTILALFKESLFISPSTYSKTGSTITYTNGDQFTDGAEYTVILKS
jgi:hypothetical protein